jgi:hypothetical protein
MDWNAMVNALKHSYQIEKKLVANKQTLYSTEKNVNFIFLRHGLSYKLDIISHKYYLLKYRIVFKMVTNIFSKQKFNHSAFFWRFSRYFKKLSWLWHDLMRNLLTFHELIWYDSSSFYPLWKPWCKRDRKTFYVSFLKWNCIINKIKENKTCWWIFIYWWGDEKTKSWERTKCWVIMYEKFC